MFFHSRKTHRFFFLDDIIIYSTTFEEDIDHIEQVMIMLQNAQLTAKPVKTQNKMGSTDLELTGVCFALKKLDCWLRGVKF